MILRYVKIYCIKDLFTFSNPTLYFVIKHFMKNIRFASKFYLVNFLCALFWFSHFTSKMSLEINFVIFLFILEGTFALEIRRYSTPAYSCLYIHILLMFCRRFSWKLIPSSQLLFTTVTMRSASDVDDYHLNIWGEDCGSLKEFSWV